MKHTMLPVLAVGSFVAATVQTVFSQGTIYISRPAFESALTSSTTITFEELPLTPPIGVYEFSIVASGVTFTSPDAGLLIRDSFSPVPATGKYLYHFDSFFPVTILLPGGVTAFGADFSSGIEQYPSYNATLTVNLVGGQAYAYDFSGLRGYWNYFGVTFPQPIASLTYDDGGTFLPLHWHSETLDNVTFGVVPEPSVLGLFALGGTFLGWRLSRRSRS